jgi:cell division protein FtsL
MRLVKDLGAAAMQREFDGASLEDIVVRLRQHELQLQAHVAELQRSLSADSAALAVAEASIETERKRVRDLETKVVAAIALPTATLNVAKLINAVIVEHPGGGPLSIRERRLVSIIEAMELEITEMHVASDAMIEAFNVSHVKNSSNSKSALESYEAHRELQAMNDKLKHAEQREQYLAAQVTELTRVLDLERAAAGSRTSLQENVMQQGPSHNANAATPFGWLSQAPGPGEHERLSRNSAVVHALETAISCIPDSQSEMSSLKSQLKIALESFWQMEVESLLLRRRLFQTSALIEAGADRLHAREKLLSAELTACRERHDQTVKQLRDAHLHQCLQLSKQAALYQVQCEIKDIIAQELKIERDATFADLQNSQAAACKSHMSAFKTMHARLVSISQEVARSAVYNVSVWFKADSSTGSDLGISSG